jgi:hypothetical protein
MILLVSCWNYFVGHLVTLLTFGRYKPRLEEKFLNCQETLKFGGGLGFHINQTTLGH